MSKKLSRFRLNEDPKSTSFTKKLNDLVAATNRANSISLQVLGGTGRISHSPQGHYLSISVPKKATSVSGGGSSGDSLRWATIYEDATADDNLKGDIHSTVTGIAAHQELFDSGNNTSEDGGDKTGFPCVIHGFADGETIVISDVDAVYNGTQTVDSTSTPDKIIIAVAYQLKTITGGYATSGGDDFGADLYAEMLNSTRLDMCVPRLSEGDVVPIVRRYYDNEGTPELRWYIAAIFMGSEDYWFMD